MCPESDNDRPQSPPTANSEANENKSMEDDPTLRQDTEMTTTSPPPPALQDPDVSPNTPPPPVPPPPAVTPPASSLHPAPAASERPSTLGALAVLAAAARAATSDPRRPPARGRAGPWGCKKCATRLTRRADLFRHEKRVHLKLRPFVCSHRLCRQRFGERFNLRRHEKSVHMCAACGRMVLALRLRRAGRAGRGRRVCWRCRGV